MSLTNLGVNLVKRLPAERAHLATIRALSMGLGVPRSVRQTMTR